MPTSTTELQMTLAQILAAVDVVWQPFRWKGPTSGTAAAAIAERRMLYRRYGLSIVGGGPESYRQAHRRQLMTLRAAGLIEINGRGRNRAVRMTDRGDALARSLTPNVRVDESWPLLELVAMFVEHCQTQAGFVLEHDLLDTPLSDAPPIADALKLEEWALPFLVRDWLDAASDVQGRLGYAITPSGRAALAAGPPEPPQELPEYTSQVGNRYTQDYLAGLKARTDWKPENPSLCVIPLSCGLWPARLEIPADA